MKIGISSWSYSWSVGISNDLMLEHSMNAQDLLDKAIELGVQVLQIADNCPLVKLHNSELMSIKNKAKLNNIQLEIGTRGVRPEILKPYLEIANILQSSLVRTLLHDEHGCPTLDEAKANIVMILPQLEKYGITLAIENHDFFKTVDLAKLIEEVNHPLVGICLDPVNNFAQGESTTEVLHNLAKYTVNFHCKDYKIARKPSMLGFDVEGCATGDGMLDVARCSRHLPNNISYIIELWTPWQGNLHKTMDLEKQWVVESVKHLTSLD